MKKKRKGSKGKKKKVSRKKSVKSEKVAPIKGSLKKELLHGEICEIVKGKIVCKKKKFEVYVKK